MDYNLILVARSENKLKQLASELEVECKVVVADLTENQACERVFQACEGLKISVFVNNAGFGGHGRFENRSMETDSDMISLNIDALTRLSHLFIPSLKKADGTGYLLNVASSAGFLPGPGMAVYYATKAYVLSLSEALHEELNGDNVVVTALCPGPVDTGFSGIAGMEGVKAFESGTDSAEFVAKKALEGLFAGKAVVIPGAGLAFMLRIGLRFLPRGLIRKISAMSMQKS
jgi:short-subunit dehydrogenase